jgi:hypothetical protein
VGWVGFKTWEALLHRTKKYKTPLTMWQHDLISLQCTLLITKFIGEENLKILKQMLPQGFK